MAAAVAKGDSGRWRESRAVSRRVAPRAACLLRAQQVRDANGRTN